MEDRRVAADAVGNIGGLFLLCLGIGIEVAADHKTVVTQHCRPVIGIDIIAQFVVAVGKDAGLSELLPEDVGDRRRPYRTSGIGRIGLVGVAAVEIRDAVQPDAHREAGERARPFVGVERRAEVGHRKAVLAVLGIGHRAGRLRRLEGHHRRQRDFVAAVHAQPRRIDRHRGQVGSQRGEGSAERHRAGRAQCLRLRHLRHFAGQYAVLVQYGAAEGQCPALLRLQRSCRNQCGRPYCNL